MESFELKKVRRGGHEADCRASQKMLIRCCSAIGGAREATGVDLVVLSSGLSVESARVPLVATVTLVNRAVHLDAGGIFVGFDKSRDGTNA